MTDSSRPSASPHDDRDDQLVALVALVRGQLLSAAEVSAATDYYGTATAVLELALAGQLRAAGGQVVPALDATIPQRAESEVAAWRTAGLTVYSFLDAAYPRALLSVHNRPLWLFVEGRWDANRDERAVAVVGTRQATPAGIARARRLSTDLSEAGFTVISGMARGIDTAAHLATLEASGRTVAVMGTGIRRRYPRENARLADSIVQSGGCLVSSFFPDQPPTRWSFPARNIVMSGLCLATIVVEAGATSGAKLQAEAALYHGRSVFLPRSLVVEHAWARDMVNEGKHGVRAVEVASADEVVKQLTLDSSLVPELAV